MTYYLNKNFVKLEKTFPDQTPVWLGGEKYPSSSSTTTTATKQLLRSWVLMYAQLMVNLISSRIQRHSPIIDHGRPAKRPVGWLGTHSKSKISKTVCLFRLVQTWTNLSRLVQTSPQTKQNFIFRLKCASISKTIISQRVE